MQMNLLVVSLLFLAVAQAAVVPKKLQGQALVDHLNANARTWTAELSTKFTHQDFMSRIMLPKYYELADDEALQEAPEHIVDLRIPAAFDARRAWPNCPSIRSVTDQSRCGSCWAVAGAATITDRICIHNGQLKNDIYSADDLLSCCTTCGNGCDGGIGAMVWSYFKSTGVCTGSSYMANEGCKPYPFQPCGMNNGTYYQCPNEFTTPKCVNRCQAGYRTSYFNDKHHGKSAYRVSNSELAIQKEIMINGPVQTAFKVYEDFEHYRNGIYEHTYGDHIGSHSIKIIGWGVENRTPYWLIANSYGTGWGESGFFRMIRGTDECGIESKVAVGIPE